jgi:hypothetical protein
MYVVMLDSLIFSVSEIRGNADTIRESEKCSMTITVLSE